MPQLDVGTFLYQVLPVLLTFWAIIYIFLVRILPHGTWLLKMRTKLANLRQLLVTVFQAQAARIGLEWRGLATVGLAWGLAQPATVITTSLPAAQPALVEMVEELLAVTEDQALEAETLNQAAYAYPVIEVESEEDEAEEVDEVEETEATTERVAA